VNTMAVDIGGTSIKVLTLDGRGAPIERPRQAPTPEPADPERLIGVIEELVGEAGPHVRASVGFPGIVKSGVTYNAPNLGNELWRAVPLAPMLEERLGVRVRAVNDADLQGLGVVEGKGVELALTLGTGLGTALFTEGTLVPNLELGHHPFRAGRTYEDLVRDSELKKVGTSEWTARVLDALGEIERLFSFDRLHLGGGNARHLAADLPTNIRLFTLEEALRGAHRLWNQPE